MLVLELHDHLRGQGAEVPLILNPNLREIICPMSIPRTKGKLGRQQIAVLMQV
jgi:hypothetical protein